MQTALCILSSATSQQVMSAVFRVAHRSPGGHKAGPQSGKGVERRSPPRSRQVVRAVSVFMVHIAVKDCRLPRNCAACLPSWLSLCPPLLTISFPRYVRLLYAAASMLRRLMWVRTAQGPSSVGLSNMCRPMSCRYAGWAAGQQYCCIVMCAHGCCIGAVTSASFCFHACLAVSGVCQRDTGMHQHGTKSLHCCMQTAQAGVDCASLKHALCKALVLIVCSSCCTF